MSRLRECLPLHTDTGKCQKCLKLAEFQLGNADYEEMEFAKHMACQACSAQNNMVPEAFKDRAERTAQRFKTTATKPGTELHTAALLHHEQGPGNPAEDHIKLAIVTRFSDQKAPSVKIGNLIKLYTVSAQMPDILNDVLKVVNPQMIDNKLSERPAEMYVCVYKLRYTHSMLFAEKKCRSRFTGNCLPEANSSTGTLGNFFAVHTATKSKAATYIENVPTQFSRLARGGKEKLVCLEFVINIDLYRDRVAKERDMSLVVTASTAITLPHLHCQSACAHWSLAVGISLLGLRISSRTGGGLVPMQPQTQSAVSLEKFSISIDPSDLKLELIKCPGGIQGFIWDRHFAKGGMKLAFDMVTLYEDGSEERVVAKQLYRSSNDDPDSITNNISLPENRTMLEAECVRLGIGGKILAEFYSFCRESKVQVFENIKFAQGYLVTEIPVSVTHGPSVASGLESFHQTHNGMTWLVEGKRASVVISFTSTLDYQARGTEDLQSDTVHAFAHFVFQYSAGSLVFADLQGTLAPTGNGSGLGDFGKEGIESFVGRHECNRLCEQLQLESLELIANPAEPEQTEPSDGGYDAPNDDED
ncbi:kinase-like domain-containing protein [Mycena rebaudengoi]|nr:kinase-like domain-containing protein [Mycena rebaudengoi]